jgi:hypothetical protein
LGSWELAGRDGLSFFDKIFPRGLILDGNENCAVGKAGRL